MRGRCFKHAGFVCHVGCLRDRGSLLRGVHACLIRHVTRLCDRGCLLRVIHPCLAAHVRMHTGIIAGIRLAGRHIACLHLHRIRLRRGFLHTKGGTRAVQIAFLHLCERRVQAL